ncbi:hypothetical protein EVAR_72070_1 [Eumeta japonica]|uniref:Uncharacterized protein n=1 Tax=Eumeta variegata TaxID=151549 RepID=A0A4C2AC35_EUMVA|nr:hypothetical protein EVAR_72070_1 [Eumeta japonica]
MPTPPSPTRPLSLLSPLPAFYRQRHTFAFPSIPSATGYPVPTQETNYAPVTPLKKIFRLKTILNILVLAYLVNRCLEFVLALKMLFRLLQHSTFVNGYPSGSANVPYLFEPPSILASWMDGDQMV